MGLLHYYPRVIVWCGWSCNFKPFIIDLGFQLGLKQMIIFVEVCGLSEHCFPSSNFTEIRFKHFIIFKATNDAVQSVFSSPPLK